MVFTLRCRFVLLVLPILMTLPMACRQPVPSSAVKREISDVNDTPDSADPLLDRWVRNFAAATGEGREKAMAAIIQIHEADEGIDVILPLLTLLDDRKTDGPGQYFPDVPSSTMEAAVMTLLKLGPKAEEALLVRGLPKLQAHLNDTDPLVREHALHALARLGKRANPATIQMVKQLSDKDNNVRRAAYLAMRAIAPIPSPELVKLLNSSDASIRSDAAEAIQDRDLPADALPTLMKCLQDPDRFVRNTAAEAIGKLGAKAEPAIPELIKNIEDLNEQDLRNARQLSDLGALEALRKIGAPAVAPLANVLESKNFVARYVAALTLGRMGPTAKSALGQLQARMKAETQYVDVACEAAAAQILIGGDPAAPLKYLEGLLENPQPTVRAAATRTIAALGKPASQLVPKLILELNDPDESVRRVAIEALKRMGSAAKPAIAVLGPRLTDDQISVRTAAAEILLSMGHAAKDAIDDLGDALEGEDSNVRKLAAETLAILGPDAKPALPELLKAIQNKEFDPYQRTAFAQAIGAIGPTASDAAPIMLDLLDATDPILRSTVARALGRIQPKSDLVIPKLITLIRKDSNSNARLSAIFALGKLGTAAKAAAEPLLELYNNSSTPIERKIALAAALGAILPDQAATYHATVLNPLHDHSSRPLIIIQRSVAMEMLELLGPAAKSAVPDLIALTRDRVADQRIRAARALASLGKLAEPAIPALVSLLKDSDATVRRAAMESLEKLGPLAKSAGPRLRELIASDPENSIPAIRAAERVDPQP
ncbi:HEAT repeat domain-containing protein [Tuwongella immobilis]|uniref:TOG domain-containing protein n=1 Tax=Tuwongella immobilis TaxID=692036 RepID=A0A6C2YWA7_9BACT|nr:HEAT repeat domain-containing protein [Tuwongella immobilis]VIP05681.1 heat domain containing protein : HEAT-repeat-containing PBS lyase OS=Anabaena sp. 90 GN=ANA_C10863 PE=4 SV=1: HEAT_2: HEAT_2: HEAT_2: HEAT_2: HEAT_2 [Tuwongella immobilis]VTS08718.1 heat domain containing protein : HEAT-repeat-containing PBS lyase OS=Anabaena sp. 90 GN=ANA_C10863 PE=4 SV=1: HEAT_2: HEAT_2: HEAT_2: HEAT_2: HEAT_2 [Tuwongella immobilis]